MKAGERLHVRNRLQGLSLLLPVGKLQVATAESTNLRLDLESLVLLSLASPLLGGVYVRPLLASFLLLSATNEHG